MSPPPCGWCETATRSAGYDRRPLFRHGRTPTSILPDIVKALDLRYQPVTCVDLHPLAAEPVSTHESSAQIGRLLPRRGASGGSRRRGVARPSASHPRGTHPHLARRGEIATNTHKLRPALSCEPLPNHVPPLPAGPLTSDFVRSCRPLRRVC
jgi:hypothetical protein